ncbi:MAG: hypothetical protein JSR67_05690 [Proteobacteria bacterium]|nr:hypothetical protein [Pseudomonadota bacterium]
MKSLSVLAAVGLLACSTAMAADPPAAPSATPIRHPSLKVCNKRADTRTLTGAARAKFIKDCRAARSQGQAGRSTTTASPGSLPRISS